MAATITRYAWEGPEETLRKALILWFQEYEALGSFRQAFPYDVTNKLPNKPLSEDLAYRIVVRMAADLAKGRYVSRQRFHTVFNVHFFAPGNPNIATLAYSTWAQHVFPDSAMRWQFVKQDCNTSSDTHWVSSLVSLHRRFDCKSNACLPWQSADKVVSC